MYKDHLTLNDIHVGDYVREYSEIVGKFSLPMCVCGIFPNGEVYLDINGHEGDVFESNIEDIASIPISEEILRGFGFGYLSEEDRWVLKASEAEVSVERLADRKSAWFMADHKYSSRGEVVSTVHALQQSYYRRYGKPLILKWSVR